MVDEKATDQPSVNEVVATDIAATVAQAADLAVAPNVTELAVSTRIENEFQNTSADTSTITKPAIVELSSASRNIAKYDAKAGDTAQSIAEQYGLSVNTIKWANNLTSDAIAANSTLEILPIDGIVYTVKSGDTVKKLANKYKSNASLITTYNDLEINGLKPGLKIIIPNGVLPKTERPGYVAPQANYGYTRGYSAGFSNGKTWFISRGIGSFEGYGYGQCTSYAAWRRAQLGNPVGSSVRGGGSWGNASTWDDSAKSRGFRVNNTPSVGAIMQNEGGYGHVAVVEVILPNGDIQVSEMNASVAGGGYNVVSGRIVPAASVHQYVYIH